MECDRLFVLTEAHLRGEQRQFDDAVLTEIPASLVVARCDYCTVKASGRLPDAVVAGLRQQTCPVCHRASHMRHRRHRLTREWIRAVAFGFVTAGAVTLAVIGRPDEASPPIVGISILIVWVGTIVTFGVSLTIEDLRDAFFDGMRFFRPLRSFRATLRFWGPGPPGLTRPPRMTVTALFLVGVVAMVVFMLRAFGGW